MRALALALLAAAAGCDRPPLRIEYRLANDLTGQCGTSSCSDIPLLCDSYVNVRIVRPEDPSLAYVSACVRITADDDTNLCSIARDNLPTGVLLPEDTLRVEVLVWPASAVTLDGEGQPVCPGANVLLDRDRGFPVVGQTPLPAIGGSTYVHPGDEVAVVELGCTDLDAINGPACQGEVDLDVVTSVIDFESLVSVRKDDAEELAVDAGSPRVTDVDTSQWSLVANEQAQLIIIDEEAQMPAWGGTLLAPLREFVCVSVDADTLPAPGVWCERAQQNQSSLSLRGVFLPEETQEQVLAALGLDDPPDQGMTLGVVVDGGGFPVAGAVVNPAPTSNEADDIVYLDATRTGIGGSATSASGLFVSMGAILTDRFEFRVADPTNPGNSAMGVGGAIRGRITVVILQLPNLPAKR